MKLSRPLLGLALSLATEAVASPVEIRVCINEGATFYFHDKAGTEDSEKPGLFIDFLHDLEKDKTAKIKIIRRTRRACQTLLESNEVDMSGIISFDEKRAKNGAYPPLINGLPDPKLAFLKSSYALFYTNAASFTWDGKDIKALSSYKLGAIAGNSIVDDLAKEGVNAQTFKSLDALLKRMQNNEIDAIAIHASRIDRLMGKMGLKQHPKQLFPKDYFLVFSNKFFQAQSDLTQNIWKRSSQYLTSSEGKAALQKYEQLDGF